jgi:hypothetical protein
VLAAATAPAAVLAKGERRDRELNSRSYTSTWTSPSSSTSTWVTPLPLQSVTTNEGDVIEIEMIDEKLRASVRRAGELVAELEG